MPLGSVEIALPYGGDFSLLPNGDLALVQDTITSAAATQQRLIFLILTNARLVNADTGIASAPNDPFNPGYGASVRATVGIGIDATVEATISAQILSALAADPDIAASPAPVVTVTQNPSNPYMLYVSVACTAITGEVITIPSLPISSGT